MASGELHIPESVTVVFTNFARTNTMQDDFCTMPRETGRGYGAYVHVGYWCFGPHLAQGSDLGKMQRLMGTIADAGDTAYAICNVANIREVALGAAAVTSLMQDMPGFDPVTFRHHWAGSPQAGQWYQDFIDALPHGGELIIQDATLWHLITTLAWYRESGQDPFYCPACSWRTHRGHRQYGGAARIYSHYRRIYRAATAGA